MPLVFLWGPPSDSVSSELFSSRYMLSSCACVGVVEKGGGLSIVSIKEVGDTSDRGGGLEEWEGGTYAILIVHNRLLSHRHLHHMGQNYPLSMDGPTYFPPSQWLPKLYHYICRNHIGPNIESKNIQCNVMQCLASVISVTLITAKSITPFLVIEITLQSKALLTLLHPHPRSRCGCAK